MHRTITQLLSIYVALAGAVLALVTPTEAVVNDPTLAVHYSFDEGTGNVATDDSVNGNDADIIGKPQWEEGPFGKAIILEQQTDIDMRGADFKNKPKDAVTICFWVNHNESADPQSVFDVISDVPGAQGLYHVEIRPGGFRWFARDTADVEIFNINPGPILPGKEWVHFAGTYDSKTGVAVTYVDGQQTHEANGKGELAQNWNQRAGIGHHVNTRWFDGRLDDFYMFTRALTAAEVKDVMDGKFLSVEAKDRLTTTWGQLKKP